MVVTSHDDHTGLLDLVTRVVREEYGFRPDSIIHLANHRNILYRVDLADGRRFVLRVGHPRFNNRANLDIEVGWLAHLSSDPELRLAKPVPTGDGRLAVDAFDGVDVRPCVLFTWAPGVPLGDGAGPSGYRALGRLSARLHGHGDWRPPDPDKLRRWDRVFYYPEQLHPVVVDSPSHDHLFSHPLRKRLLTVAALADRLIADRWSSATPILVHGDLHEWNVHMYLGRLWAFDFEDVMLSLPAQDLATSLYGARTRPDIDRVVASFRTGYEEEEGAIWPVSEWAELEAYWAARQVMLMNHAARRLPPGEAGAYFQLVEPWLRGYLERVS